MSSAHKRRKEDQDQGWAPVGRGGAHF
jgi:hypothetical protein